MHFIIACVDEWQSVCHADWKNGSTKLESVHSAIYSREGQTEWVQLYRLVSKLKDNPYVSVSPSPNTLYPEYYIWYE